MSDPLGDLGRAILNILLNPQSWEPGPTQAVVAATAAARKRKAT